ncbi:MAG: nitrogen fixation protein NifQ [Variovorax sp.]
MDTRALRELDRRLQSRRDEVDDLMALLREHADPQAGSAEDIESVAYAIALASLGDNHLWQDMQLPSRGELSALISRWFPRLAQRNTHDMKWKKFLYKQLCEREEINVCKSPSCGVCSDHAMCFGPEERSAGIA